MSVILKPALFAVLFEMPTVKTLHSHIYEKLCGHREDTKLVPPLSGLPRRQQARFKRGLDDAGAPYSIQDEGGELARLEAPQKLIEKSHVIKLVPYRSSSQFKLLGELNAEAVPGPDNFFFL